MSNICCVLHVFGRMSRGGAEVRTVELLRYMRNTDVEQHFCVLSGERGPLDEEIRSLGGEVHYVPLGMSFIPRFLNLLRKGRYDVVHSHVFYVSGLLVFLGLMAGVKRRIVHFRSMSDGRPATFLRKIRNLMLRAMIDGAATDILAVSEGAMASAWRADWRADRRCRVVYNGFNPPAESTGSSRDVVRATFGIGPETRLVIHVGRMDTPKNHVRLAEIFARMAARRSDVHLLLVGRGENQTEAELRAFFHRRGIEQKVTFAGQRADVECLLAAADLMIFPSLWEGLPGAIIEARIAGVPVIASDLPGVREIARHLEGITILSLEEEDRLWAETALAQLHDPRHDRTKLDGTPFSMSTNASTIAGVWEGRT